eukprot:1645058-Pyramimonas_sp.AAC.1
MTRALQETSNAQAPRKAARCRPALTKGFAFEVRRGGGARGGGLGAPSQLPSALKRSQAWERFGA